MTTLYVVIEIYEDVSWNVELITANFADATLKQDAMRLEVLKSEKSIGPDENLDDAWEHWISNELQPTNITISEYEYEPGLEPESDPLTPWTT